MIDIEKLDNLPHKENRAKNLTRRYGNVWNVLDYRRVSDKMRSPYNISEVIIKSNVGKSFDMAFHYYCTKVDKQHQHLFLDKFNQNRNWSYGYFVDKQGLIQEVPHKKYKKPIYIQSQDYKVELRHKVTGHKKSEFKEVKKKISKYTYVVDYYAYGEENNGFYGKMKPINERYRAKESDFESIVVKGWIKHFESKNDPRFKRYMAEKVKSFKKLPKKVLSDVEYRTILRAKVLKDREETKIKLEAKGMRPNAFTNNKTDANV